MSASCFINPEHVDAFGVLAHFSWNIEFILDIDQFMDDLVFLWLLDSYIFDHLGLFTSRTSLLQ